MICAETSPASASGLAPTSGFCRDKPARRCVGSGVVSEGQPQARVDLHERLLLLVNPTQESRVVDRDVRLLSETAIGLADGRYALALVERLPQCSETLRRLARRR
jgi:hypothetical protein